MIYSISYVWEKFSEAVRTLVRGSDSIQERLFNAVAFNNFVGLEAVDWETGTENSKKDFLELMEKISEKEASGNEGRWKATLSEMSEEEASELAEKILYLYDEICSVKYGK